MVIMEAEFAISEINRVLRLDAEEGDLFWRGNIFEDGKERRASGYVNPRGYKSIVLFGRRVLEHRVVYALHNGSWPKIVDHIDRVKTNNRPDNLREANHSTNNQNRNSRKGASSKFLGVFWDSQRGKWRAEICKSGIKKSLGRFSKEEEAAEAYNTAARHLFGDFASLNDI